VTLCVGEESSESCLLLLLIATLRVKVLKEKVLILSERFLFFLARLILQGLLDSRFEKGTPMLPLAVSS